MARIYDMKQKEVINSSDGVRLGFISDIEVSFDEGKIMRIFVPAPAKLMGLFGNQKEYSIEWDHIKKIGEDIILVDVNVNTCLKDVNF